MTASHRISFFVACALAGCGGDPFAEGPTADPETEGSEVPGPLLEVEPSTLLSELSQAERMTLCQDVIRVFDADVDSARYLRIHCTDAAWAGSGGDQAACVDAFDACQEGLPPPRLSDRVADTLGCEFNVPLDSPCVTVEQTLECWRAFGVAYEAGFLEGSGSTPESCEDAAQAAPELSDQVGFSVPRACSEVADLQRDCAG